jgi:hypothetical protein
MGGCTRKRKTGRIRKRLGNFENIYSFILLSLQGLSVTGEGPPHAGVSLLTDAHNLDPLGQLGFRIGVGSERVRFLKCTAGFREVPLYGRRLLRVRFTFSDEQRSERVVC